MCVPVHDEIFSRFAAADEGYSGVRRVSESSVPSEADQRHSVQAVFFGKGSLTIIPKHSGSIHRVKKCTKKGSTEIACVCVCEWVHWAVPSA